jgi:hypothetical protein
MTLIHCGQSRLPLHLQHLRCVLPAGHTGDHQCFPMPPPADDDVRNQDLPINDP